ncbi:YdcF family protein [Dichotomicrobium thermohalophilum]|uniref:Uncharacterized SAM-binding protein YcdF (DUF218 family) n=1 Tax=Dichotomicrobium thermohalophilum TaxID=933063 RepID=A0A397Q4M2_9HYPH|nr:YdcF family protein [Dichotomicrobium thermohalophilum]RIA55988.1 uncharacterized SAM-binding protein YcdF (DUF218 family) [Dichotomicrobium thermohalophilum]
MTGSGLFFYVSKLVWFFVQPSSLVALLLLGGLVLAIWRRRWGLRIVALGALLYVIAGFSPLGHWLMMPLEDRFARPKLDAPVDGIIVLGGAVDTLVSKGRGVTALNEAAERLSEGAALARRFPDARLVFSGGSGEILYSGTTEAAGAKRLFTRLGIAPERLLLENRSRNTAENAAFTRELVQPRPGERWLLVTSAFHMPRAVGCFRAVGFEVMPWPVDYRTSGEDDLWRFFPRASEGLRRVDLAAKEWAGLLAYSITGRTSTFLPGPR